MPHVYRFYDLCVTVAAVLFALALLCAGQSASITATLAGQIVSEGFLEWKVSVRTHLICVEIELDISSSRRQPFTRRLITRLIGLIPSAIVAAAVGQSGINQLLIASQVVLSIILPFVVFPLVYLTSSHVVMRVKVPSMENGPGMDERLEEKSSSDAVEEINYQNGKIMMCLGYFIFLIILVTNAYVLVTLIMGTGG